MASDSKASPWKNSFQVATLVTSALTPLVIALLGGWFTWATSQENARRDREAKVIEKRFVLWDTLAPQLNDIYVYSMHVGHWRTLHPDDVLKTKLATEKLVYAFRPFFTDDFVAAYRSFIGAAFDVNSPEEDAAISKSACVQADPDHAASREEHLRTLVHCQYYAILRAASSDLSLPFSNPAKPRPDADDASGELAPREAAGEAPRARAAPAGGERR